MLSKLFIGLSIATSVLGTCPTLIEPQLCATPDAVVDLTECNSTTVKFPPFTPCCRLQAEVPFPCEDVNATQACRSMELSSGLCPGLDGCNCFDQQMSMTLNFAWLSTNNSCCSTCRCYGDPHCESFTGAPDTWIICDARTPKPSNPALCPMSAAECALQTDQNGNQCQWLNTNNIKWNIGLLGSPCQFAPSDNPPYMILYSAEGFSYKLIMGDRSVIRGIVIEDGPNTYAMTSDDCFAFALSNQTINPWRSSYDSGPSEEPANWLPYTWTWGPSADGRDVLWTISGLESLISLTVLCTRTPNLVNKQILYGPTRLNVDISEPLNWQSSVERPDAAGFCPTGVITKQGSTANTETILSKGYCSTNSDQLLIAQALCGAATTNAGIDDCQLRWCTTPFVNPVPRSSPVVQQCLQDIVTFGWSAAFCATYTLPTGLTTSSCQTNDACRECITELGDISWESAVLKYKIIGVTPQDCITSRNELPPDLPGSCTAGVRVQYYSSDTQTWITQFAIPSDVCIQGNSLALDTTIDLNLFVNPMRIIQCSPPVGECLSSNICSAQVGFTASIDYQVQKSQVETVYELWEAGTLVCDPQHFSSPTACLGFTPPQMCPCTRRLQQNPK